MSVANEGSSMGASAGREPSAGPCSHAHGREPLAGDYGRRPHAFERCVECGYVWARRDDGSLTALGVPDPVTGIYRESAAGRAEP
jgi:hypothetical protein